MCLRCDGPVCWSKYYGISACPPEKTSTDLQEWRNHPIGSGSRVGHPTGGSRSLAQHGLLLYSAFWSIYTAIGSTLPVGQMGDDLRPFAAGEDQEFG